MTFEPAMMRARACPNAMSRRKNRSTEISKEIWASGLEKLAFKFLPVTRDDRAAVSLRNFVDCSFTFKINFSIVLCV